MKKYIYILILIIKNVRLILSYKIFQQKLIFSLENFRIK